MITAVDTNIFLDVLIPNPLFVAASNDRLTEAARNGAVIVSEPVFAELSANFEDELALFRFLAALGIQLQPSHLQTLMVAGRVWHDYVRRRPEAMQCAACGNREIVVCSSCGNRIRSRQHIVADFIIGAHASLHADVLLTRDRGFYRTYFPNLTLA